MPEQTSSAMQVARSLDEVRALLPTAARTVVTIGNFDGVHVGHQAVIRAVRRRAEALGAVPVVVTFDPHPSHVLASPEAHARLITPLPQKLQLLESCGVALTLVLPFNQATRTLSAREFAQSVLCDALRTVEIHEGETFRFGHQAEGDIAGLARLGAELGFAVQAYEPLVRRGAPVSSSRVRSLVQRGEIRTARALLGRAFALESTPARGRGYGTRYAVPTVNLTTPAALLPGNGVYVTELRIGTGDEAAHFFGVTNAGNRPTFGADSYAIETHLFEFRPIDLTEETPLRLRFLRRLRDERRFPDPEALKAQIGRDVQQAQRFLSLCKRLKGFDPSGN